MKHLLVLLLACLCSLVMSASSALADANRLLDALEAKRFVDSLDPAYAFSKRMESEGKAKYTSVIKKHLTGDDYNVYTQNMIHFKETYPQEYEAFTVVIKQFGFSSCEEWASVGDAVILAYLAGQEDMNEIAKDMEKNMTPEVLASMPPEIKAQTEAAMTMMKVIKNIPPRNIETVKPYAQKISNLTKDSR